MKLERFLADTGMSDGQLAELISSDPSTINRLKGPEPLRKASLALALQIEAATGGRVRAEDLPLARKTKRALAGLRAIRDGAAPTQASVDNAEEEATPPIEGAA